MTILINNPIQNTWVFIAILFFALVLSVRSQKNNYLTPSLTQELKGLAILLVIFSHICYFLSTDHRFLFPLSILAGVGVDLFLFVSGYGLTISQLKNNDNVHLSKINSVWQFYKKRLSKLFVPLWTTLIIFLFLDFFVLGISYPKNFIIKSFLGIFTSANIFSDLNSPLWYFTLILIYYILFPIFFSKKRPWVSAVAIYLTSYYFIDSNAVFFKEIINLLKVHLWAFPLGIIFAWLPLVKVKKLIDNIKFKDYIRSIVVIVLLFIISYLAINSGVGKSLIIEESISILTMIAIVLLFIIKRIEFSLFSIFGLYSYEIYLLHWPIMYRYDFLFNHLSGCFATCLYLLIFICLGWILKTLSKHFLYPKNFHNKQAP